MNASQEKTAATRLQAYLHDAIPLVRHMQARVEAYDAHGLTLSAPLAANINHKQTAFGGSLASLATLSCWGLLWLMLESQPDVHIVVNESRIHYLRPVTDTLMARCVAPTAEIQQRFLDTLQRRDKARLELHAQVVQSGLVCAEFSGTFVAFRDTDD